MNTERLTARGRSLVRFSTAVPMAVLAAVAVLMAAQPVMASSPRGALGAAGSGDAAFAAGSAARSGAATLALRPGAIASAGGISLMVPRRGLGVEADALRADGGTQTLTAQWTADGRVDLSWAASAAPGVAGAAPGVAGASVGAAGPARGAPVTAPKAAAQPAGSPSACSDRAYKLNSSWWHTTYRWSFRASTTPAYLTHAAAQKALVRGAYDITHEVNDCGRSDRVSATSTFLGSTSVGSNISSSAACLANDGHNVVTFGTLPVSYVAFSCWWFSGHTNIEADMRINKHDYRWTSTTAGCTNQYVIQAVSTHEFGHVFGLGHVSESQHANLTMSPQIAACDNSAATLGLGDMLGLEVRY